MCSRNRDVPLVKELIGKKYGSTFVSSQGSKDWKRVQRSELHGQCQNVQGITNDDSSEVDDPEDPAEIPASDDVGHIRALESALNNDAFLNKTTFSQEKYLRKKHKKYAKEFTVLKPSLIAFCEANPTEIRADMLGSLLRFAGANSRSAVAVVDDAAGLITASLLLMGCKVDRYIFGKSTGQERGQHMFGVENSENLRVIRDMSEAKSTRAYDSILIAHNGTGEFEIDHIFNALQGQLKLSGTIAFYSRNIEPMLKLFHQLRTDTEAGSESRYINLQLTEQMFREQEILKDRTHPVMQQSINLFKGFILSGIKVVA